MLDLAFQPPDSKVSAQQTKKRLELLTWFVDYIRPSVTSLLVSGSMSYGQNYSVTTKSDIDMQLLVTKESIDALAGANCFDDHELAHALEGYKKGLYKQFSLVFNKDDVPMECHFWDEQAYLDAITYRAENTKRLRSTTDTPSTDHGFSFDREESVKDYYGESIEGFAVADFPSFRKLDDKLFLCRPITNVLGLPLVKISTPLLDAAIEECWLKSVRELFHFCNGVVDLKNANITNILPGKNKMSPTIIQKVHQKTVEALKKAIG